MICATCIKTDVCRRFGEALSEALEGKVELLECLSYYQDKRPKETINTVNPERIAVATDILEVAKNEGVEVVFNGHAEHVSRRRVW